MSKKRATQIMVGANRQIAVNTESEVFGLIIRKDTQAVKRMRC